MLRQLPATSPPPLAQELLRDICEMAQAFADRHEMHPSTLPTMMQVRLQELTEGMGEIMLL